MEQFDLILFNEHIHRILFIKGDSALIINCITLNMPYWVRMDELSNCSRVENALKKLSDIASLSPQKQKLAHQRYTLIAPVLPFINNEYMRSKLITQVSEINNVSKQTIRKYLCSFLAYQNISCLVPCEDTEIRTLTSDEKNFRWAINKYFYSPMKHTLKNSYLLMLKDKYTDANGE